MAGTSGGQSRYVILAAMIFAVAMTFIDQTIVSIAVPKIQTATYSQSRGGQPGPIPSWARLDFAYGIRTVLCGMAIVMLVAAVVAFIGLRPGVQEDLPSSEVDTTAEVRA
jgi:biopolymer transport protein ExbD